MVAYLVKPGVLVGLILQTRFGQAVSVVSGGYSN